MNSRPQPQFRLLSARDVMNWSDDDERSPNSGLSLRTKDAVGTSRQQRLRNRAYWERVAARYRRRADEDFDDSLYDLAIERLAHGDVSDTAYGLRVGLRQDLGDDRQAASAYWPERRACLCRSMKSRRYCSHDLAARIFRFNED